MTSETFKKERETVNKHIFGSPLGNSQVTRPENYERVHRLSVLFVCKANVCRSPACVGVLKRLLHETETTKLVSVDSAGILDEFQGKKAAWKMRFTAMRRGYQITGRARRINRIELSRPGFVIAMDRSVLMDLRRLHSHPMCDLHLLSDFLPRGYPIDLPDPFGRTLRLHGEVLSTIQMACDRILNELLLPRLRAPARKETGLHYDSPRCSSYGQLQLS